MASKSLEVHWEITNECNLFCKHCIINAGNKGCNELDTSQVKRAIDMLITCNVKTISFTGGEPFCRSDFREILQYCNDRDINIQIITNGILVDDIDLLYFKENHILYGISLDGTNSAVNDYIRGEGTFKKIINLLKRAQQIEYQGYIYFTVNNLNYHQIEDLICLSQEFGCHGVHINQLNEMGRAKENDNLFLKNTQDILGLVNSACKNTIKTELQGPATECWADSSSILVTSNGNIYQCTELSQRSSKNFIGNITTFDLRRWCIDNSEIEYTEYNCCYNIYWNSYVTLVLNNNDVDCCMIEDTNVNYRDLKELYIAFDRVNNGTDDACINCSYPNCMGYIWLLKKESELLFDNNVPIVEVNEQMYFINSFETSNGIDLSQKKPKCIFKKTGCAIHNIKPLICHMYPIGPETLFGNPVWVIHTDCAFTQAIINSGKLADYMNNARQLISKISPPLYAEIKQMYTNVDYISAHPDGSNEYILLREF